MINIMYLVLTALLALNVSAEILNAFKVVEFSLSGPNTVLNESNKSIYANFEEIPQLTKEYIVYVCGEQDLENVPLEDINSFMDMLYTAEMKRREEYEDGWVI